MFQQKDVQSNPGQQSVINTRNLLLVSFVTLFLTTFIFLVALLHFDRTNRETFSQVERSISTLTRSTEVNRMLLSLELDIRELINVIIHESYRLTSEKEKLRARFDLIAQKAGESEASLPQQALIAQLRKYRASLEKLLWDYGAINSALYEVYYYLESFEEEFRQMDAAASRLMVEQADRGRNTEALQQAYVLITYAHEQLLQVHVLINTSLAEHNPLLLAGEEREQQPTVRNKLAVVGGTLQTLRAADRSIASSAATILDILPLLQENIVDLAKTLNSLGADETAFKVERDACLQRLEEVSAYDLARVTALSGTVNTLGRKGRDLAWFLALAVLVVSVIGLLLTRKMSRHLAETAQAALLARQRSEELNTLLQGEIQQRRQVAEDLRLARDELEQRVQQRTEQLSASNRSLALEIEERRNVEYALASEKERLTVTLRSIGDGVITAGINGTVILLNKVAEDLTGWSQEEAYGRPLPEVFNIINKNSGEACPGLVETLLHKGSISSLAAETILVSRNGSRHDIDESGAPICDSASVIIGIVLVFRDITVKKKLEEDALKNEKLKAVGVLAGGIAHDFNNILAAILGNINLARLQIDQGAAERAIKMLEDAEKASLRARGLTQQLLTFAKGGEPVRRVEHLEDIIRDSTDFILSGSKVICRYVFADNLWPVNIDAGQMSQVIQNIVINAMHVMPDGGEIEISCENFENDRQQIASLPGGCFVRVRIADQGAGIPEEFIDQIFDPYFTTKKEGSGLGLALTYSIINKHQGHIEVQSGKQGTAFTIFLPAHPEKKVYPKSTGKEQLSKQALARILIMDDEDMVREIARDMLLHLGFEVETARDGDQAVAIYRDRMGTDASVDLVIMDLTVPGGMGGKEAILRLREIDPGVRAIVSSGYSNDPVMAEYQRHGFAGVVNKPFQLSELLAAVNEVLGSRQSTAA